MCFNTTKTAKAKIAKEDIQCWKVIENDYSNHFQWALSYKIFYTPNEKMPHVPIMKKKCVNELRTRTFFYINEGYHSHQNKELAEMTFKMDPSKGNLSMTNCSIIREFIIPKGTKYFENKNEYVSETIILKS